MAVGVIPRSARIAMVAFTNRITNKPRNLRNEKHKQCVRTFHGCAFKMCVTAIPQTNAKETSSEP